MNEDVLYRRFMITLFGVFLAAVPLVLAFNWFIDPYGIFGSPSIAWLNQEKPQTAHHIRLIKALEVQKEKPTSIFLGSSRTSAAMEVEDLKQLVPDSNAYNLGLPGSTIEELYAYLEHVLHNQPHLQEVIMDIDLFMFNQNRKLNVEFNPHRLKTTSMTRDDYVGSLLTAHALKNSLWTVKANMERYFHPQKESVELLDSKKLSSESRKFLKDILIARDWYGKFELDPKQIAFFSKIVQTCRDRGISLKVYFSPAQAFYWEAIYQKNLWTVFEDLKLTLCQIHPFYDFTGYNAVTTRQCEKADAPFYTDCSHYTRVVGQMILAKLYAQQPLDGDDFGLFMLPERASSHFKQILREREAWVQANSSIVEFIGQLAQEHPAQLKLLKGKLKGEA